MIVRIPFKCPDALEEAIESEVEDSLPRSDDPDKDALIDEEFDEIVSDLKKKAEKWFRYGETVTLVIDFDEMTCIVEEV